MTKLDNISYIVFFKFGTELYIKVDFRKGSRSPFLYNNLTVDSFFISRKREIIQDQCPNRQKDDNVTDIK